MILMYTLKILIMKIERYHNMICMYYEKYLDTPERVKNTWFFIYTEGSFNSGKKMAMRGGRKYIIHQKDM